MHDASVTLGNFIFFKSSFAKVVIHIACKYKVISLHVLLGDLKNISEPLVRLGTLVNIKSMAVKVPKLVWVFFEETWVCRILESHFCLAEIRVFAPETL